MSEATDGLQYAVTAAPKGANPAWHIGEALKCSLELGIPVFLQVSNTCFIRVDADQVVDYIAAHNGWDKLPPYDG